MGVLVASCLEQMLLYLHRVVPVTQISPHLCSPARLSTQLQQKKKKIIQIFSTDSSEEHFSEIFENKSVKLLKFQNIEETASVEHLKPKT